MSTIYLPIDQIKMTDNRFPDLPDEQFERLLSSIAENNILEPLLVKKENGNYLLIQGHQRYHAAQELRFKEVPCKIVDNEQALAAEFDVNLYRRHLTTEEVSGYENIKKELEGQDAPRLIPELSFLEEALPAALLKTLKNMPENSQRTFYNSIPQKYVTDTEETKRLELMIKNKSCQIEEQTRTINTLQNKINDLKELERNYETLRHSKKTDFEKALADAKKRIEETYASRQHDDDDNVLAERIEMEKERLEFEYKEKYNQAVEEYRQIAVKHSHERENLQREINPLKEENEKLKKDVKMYQTSAENTRNAEKWAQEKLEKIVKMHKIPDMMKTLTREMSFLHTRMVSCKEYLIELGDAVYEDRAAILPTLRDYQREMSDLSSTAGDIFEMVK